MDTLFPIVDVIFYTCQQSACLRFDDRTNLYNLRIDNLAVCSIVLICMTHKHYAWDKNHQRGTSYNKTGSAALCFEHYQLQRLEK